MPRRDPPDASRAAVGARFADAAEYAMVGADAQGNVTYLNRAAERLFGYAPDELIGEPASLILPEPYDGAHRAALRRIGTLDPARFHGRTRETYARRRDGSIFPAEFSFCAWRGPHGPEFGGVFRDISEWRERDDRLVRLAHHDELTGLLNRAAFQERLQDALASGRQAAVLMLDLDGFKEVNDRWGHATGDGVLREIGIRLPRLAAQHATLARFGGDEFAVLLPDVADPVRLKEFAEGILEALASPFVVDGHVLHLGGSAGGAIGPSEGGEELIGNADLALFRAKQDGKRRFRLYEPNMRAALVNRLSTRNDLRLAVERREFELFFQPQVEFSTGLVVGAEALLRWRHPERGLLLPGAFLSELEQHPLVGHVGRWIVAEACQHMAEWRTERFAPISVAVNLFETQVRNGTVEADVMDALETFRLPGDAIELEITERIALQVDDRIVASFRDLRALGVGVAFDDFGTGYASLSSLKRFPLTHIKIDRSFIRDLMDDQQDRAIVKALIQMARDLRLDVTAEGIETPAQQTALARMGCKFGQGFLYSEALTGAQFAEMQRRAARSAMGERNQRSRPAARLA